MLMGRFIKVTAVYKAGVWGYYLNSPEWEFRITDMESYSALNVKFLRIRDKEFDSLKENTMFEITHESTKSWEDFVNESSDKGVDLLCFMTKSGKRIYYTWSSLRRYRKECNTFITIYLANKIAIEE